MATLLDRTSDSARAHFGVQFFVTDAYEGHRVMQGARQAVLDFLEGQGFAPEGVKVIQEVQTHQRKV